MNQPAWPSLTHQLTEAKAPPGSALEKLIQDNQDFHLLKPEEANDTIGVPPWLRVLWRKHHPELVYSANDATCGYPRVLKNMYTWMLTHPDLQSDRSSTPASPTTDTSASVAETETTAPTITFQPMIFGTNFRISGAQTTGPRPRSESDIRMNYNNTSQIIAASNTYPSGGQSQFYSPDGGGTWYQTGLRLVSGDSFHTDPAVDWTSDGTAWAITIGGNTSTWDSELRAYKSNDGGATWSFDDTVSNGQRAADKPMMWVDHSPTSPFRDTIYVIWHNGPPAFVNRRTGPAGAWQTPIQVSGAETRGSATGGDIKTNSFGDVFAFWPDTDTGSRKLLVAKSTDGGVTFASPVTIATTFASYQIGVPSFDGRKALIYISAAAYRTTTKNLVYATWVDLTGAPGCTTNQPGPLNNEPGSNVASTCKSRIWFSRSTDGGRTWEASRMINNQASLNDQFHPRLVVDETNGRLIVTYYDTVDDPGRRKTDLWYQSSSSDGATWSAAIKITTAQTDETMIGIGADRDQYGDYNGLSGYAGIFFPTWTDRRSGGSEEIWTAPIFSSPYSLASTGIGLSGSVWPNGTQQHVYYLSSTDGHVHWLWWLPTPPFWRYGGDLTAQTGTSSASSSSVLSSYVWSDGSSQHVFYVGTDSRVHELYWLAADGRWRPGGSDLTTAQVAAPTARASALTSHVFPNHNWQQAFEQDVFYLSTAGHVHWLSWWLPTTGWRYGGDLTAQTGTPAASSDSVLSGYVWPNGTQQHVFYVGTDSRVRELYWLAADRSWRPGGNDLITAQAGAPLARATVLTSSVWPEGGQQDVFYLSTDGHVHWLQWLPTTGWRYGGDLTAQTGTPGASSDSVLSSYVWPDSGSQHVFYIGADSRVHELYWLTADGRWHPGGTDLMTAQAGAPGARATAVISYVWPDSGSQHVFYRGANDHVHELLWLPTPPSPPFWRYAGDLTIGLDLQVQPCPPPLNQPAPRPVTVWAKDEATGQPVVGDVFIDDRPVNPSTGSRRRVGSTNTPFSYPFRSRTVGRGENQETFYPTGSVVAPGYSETTIDFCFPSV